MSSIFDGIGDEGVEQLDENLRKWFKEKWVRFGPDGKIRGACARGDDSEGKPKCLPQKKAHSLGKKGRKYAASKKRREDPNPERRGKAKNVATKKKSNEDIQVNEKWSQKYKDSINCSNPKGFSQKAHCAGKKKNEDMHEETKKCPECGGPMYHESMMTEKKDACYHKVKSRYKVWPSAYASGALVQCRKKGASNWGTGGKKNESNIMKGIVDEARAKQYVKPYNSPKTGEQIGWKSSDGYHVKYWQMFAKDSAIKHAKISPDEVQEDYTGEFAAEVTPAINPYGGLKDRKHRGAISETPTDNPTGASGEGGWRRTDIEEEQLDEKCWKGYKKQGMKTMFGKKYPNCVKNTNEEEQLDEKCWDTHKQVGMKKKGDRMVPNCVPKESAIMRGLKRESK